VAVDIRGRVKAAMSMHHGVRTCSGEVSSLRILENTYGENKRSGRESHIFVTRELTKTAGGTMFHP
jgi:hypothetical protein